MKVIGDVPEYSANTGFVYSWDANFKISVKIVDGTVQIYQIKRA